MSVANVHAATVGSEKRRRRRASKSTHAEMRTAAAQSNGGSHSDICPAEICQRAGVNSLVYDCLVMSSPTACSVIELDSPSPESLPAIKTIVCPCCTMPASRSVRSPVVIISSVVPGGE